MMILPSSSQFKLGAGAGDESFAGDTGCSLMILEKYQIPTLTRKQSVSLKWCHFLPYPSPFWYLVSKKIHNHSVIIHLVRLLRCETVKIWKIHWKLETFCFKYWGDFANYLNNLDYLDHLDNLNSISANPRKAMQSWPKKILNTYFDNLWLPPSISDHLGQSLTTLGNLCPPRTISDNLLPSLTTLDNLWPPQTISDHPRQSLTTSDNLWPPRTISDHLRQSLTTSDNLCPPRTIFDNLRQSLTIWNNLWAP